MSDFSNPDVVFNLAIKKYNKANSKYNIFKINHTLNNTEAQEEFTKAKKLYAYKKNYAKALVSAEYISKIYDILGDEYNENLPNMMDIVNFYMKLGENIQAIQTCDEIAKINKEITNFRGCRLAFVKMAEIYKLDYKSKEEYETWIKILDVTDIDSFSDMSKTYEELTNLAIKQDLWSDASKYLSSYLDLLETKESFRWGTNKIILKLILCNVLIKFDITELESNIKKYSQKFPQFDESPEHKLVLSLSESISESDTDIFSEKIGWYDLTNKLDNMMVDFLQKIKDKINSDEIQENETDDQDYTGAINDIAIKQKKESDPDDYT
jgi:hypothetical protein